MFNKLNISKVIVISPQSPVPSPQSPITSPQSPITNVDSFSTRLPVS
ncbi:hypothetical protein [Sphaerospermopsis kisseleviana]|nr:hypothetical protein [Sphaerospermopsis kisseleviana]